MAPQQHKIMRQVLELGGCPEGTAPKLQAALREAYYRDLLPLLDRACAKAGRPGRIDRIDRLEIDLGAVALEPLGAALGDRLAAVVDRALATAINAAPAVDGDLELFAQHARTGSVPWWADRGDRGLLDAALQRLLARDPQSLRESLLAQRDADRVWRRLALSYSDFLLAELAAVLAHDAVAAPTWQALCAALRADHGPGVRQAWWEEALGAAGAAAAAGITGAGLGQGILVRLARRRGTDLPALRAALRRRFFDEAAAAAAPGGAAGLWRDWAGDDLTTAAAPETPPAAAESPSHGVRTLLRLQAGGAPEAAAWARLLAMQDRLPAPLRARAESALGATGGEGGHGAAAMAALDELLRMTVERGRVAVPLTAPLPASANGGREPRRASDRDRNAGFNAADAVAVDNAGLVLVWPFLATFFERLGLAADGRFADEAAAQRGVGLLQFIAAGDGEPPEALLPLNKVLCGLAPDSVFDFGAPIATTETAACEELLGAVIAHATLLQGMSIAGLRANFLLRPGSLGARDGHWLLRVERLAQDVVVDRMPWSVRFVKLPWMAELMQVEW